MNVSNLPVVTFVHERRATDMVPHLPRDHGETEKQGACTPHVLVVQKVQVVPSQIKEPGHQTEQDHEGHSSRVIRRAENANLKLNSLARD